MSDENNNITETTEGVETGSTPVQESKNQVEEKLFTQDDVDRIIRSRLAQAERKFDGVDVDEYKTLKQQQAEAERAQMIKKEQFQELLQKQKAEADSRISQLQSELERVHIDGALTNAASKLRAVNPGHVANLLRSQIRLGESGTPEVLDADGNVRYNTETALPVSIDEVVAEFIQENSYFRTAAPAGTGSAGNARHSTSREVELKDLDMNNPEHRKIFAEKYSVGNARTYQAR